MLFSHIERKLHEIGMKVDGSFEMHEHKNKMCSNSKQKYTNMKHGISFSVTVHHGWSKIQPGLLLSRICW